MAAEETEGQGDNIRPLSHRQNMIWTGQVLDPEVPLYNMAHAYTIEADLDVPAFQAAFGTLVEGSDALRTVIIDRDGVPAQQVLDAMDTTLAFVDFAGPGGESGDSDFHGGDGGYEQWITDRSKDPFDLATKLFDSALLKIGDRRFVWYINQHHLICDAWAVSLLLRRLGELYNLAVDGRLDDAEPTPAYSDFLDTEAELLGTPAQQRSAEFWSQKLDLDKNGKPEPLTFFGPRPVEVGPEAVRIVTAIDGARAARLNAFLADPAFAALSPELTALRFFHTVLFAYLHRLGGAERIVVGTPFHNRAKRAAKNTVGLFMNLYPVVATIDEDQTMDGLADALGAEVFENLQHARFPMGSTEESGAFEVVLNYLHIPHETFGELPVEDTWVHPGAADRGHSLRWQVRRSDDGFKLFFEVKTALFDDAAQQELVAHVLGIIDQWLDDRTIPVRSLNLLTDGDRQRLVEGFNTKSGPPVPTESVVHQFEAMVAASPDAVAVEGGELTLTYDQLNRSANRVANHLLATGLQPGDYVGILLPRSPDVVVAILGVLKAGGAYLPMEPSTPAGRLTQMVKDTGARLICTDAGGRTGAEQAGAAAVLFDGPGSFGSATTDRGPDAVGGQTAGAPDEPDKAEQNPAGPTSLDATAYAIFTSGSTGKPKGVPVHHRGLSNYISWAGRQYTDGELRRFALFTSLAFDLTITSIFVPLTSGGSIITYPDDVEGGTPSVVSVWRDNRADIVKLTPSHLAIIRQLGLVADNIKVAVIGGEDLTTDLAQAIQHQHPDLAMYNEYGPTETVVGCMIHRFDQETDRWPSVPIGLPAANAEIFVLDRYGAPVPPGVIGEIHIGGPGVTHGYLGRPDLTAERFVPRSMHLGLIDGNVGSETETGITGAEADPGTAARSDGLLYRSGDLGRWRMVDGPPQLEFLGRADDQVKIRGHRIELGEIESALVAHRGVDHAAVTVVTETVANEATVDGGTAGGASKREIARLVAHYQGAVAYPVEELRSTLAENLPEYMVPTSFVHHRQLPLTRNGKIDRAALVGHRVDGRTVIDRSAMTDADRRAAEVLAGIWGTIFHREIAFEDNFFELGGDSITAIQIADRASAQGVALTPRQLFEAKTLAATAMAATLIEAGEPVPTESSSAETYRLTPTQSGMLFHSLASPGSGVYEGQIVHHMRGSIDPVVLGRCWRALVKRHDVFRLSFGWEGEDEPRQTVGASVTAPLVHHDWSDGNAFVEGEVVEASPGATDLQLERFLADDRAAGFDLKAGPPVRVAVIRLSDHEVMVWSFHHIAFDGWSIALAMNELLDSYQAEIDGRTWEPTPRRPFADYVDWLGRQDAAGAERFWTEHLQGFDSPTSLPRTLSTNDPVADSYAATMRDLPAVVEQQLSDFAGRERVTMSTVLQAAWGLVLARYEGSDDVVFGVTTSGRPASLSDAESIVGMLVTTLPNRVGLPEAETPGEWLRRVQADQLSIREHEYASLVDVQRWSDLPTGQPLFDSILVVENFPDYQPPADDTEVLAIDSRAYRVKSNYPLSLIVLPGDALTIKAVYDPAQFSAPRIDEVLDHMEAAIASIVSGTASTVAELSVVVPAEQQELLALGTGEQLPGAADGELPLLPEVIRRRAEQQPNAVAAVCGDTQLTYRQLLDQASALADRLRASGAGPNSPVGVLLERSVEMVVAIIGVHEAGAAYVPLDPTYPTERLQFMMSDAEIPLVVTSPSADRSVLGAAGSSADAGETVPETGLVVYTTGDRATTDPNSKQVAMQAKPGTDRRRFDPGVGAPAESAWSVSADDLAYVIYTSGSTGTPNGVPITHGNLAFSTAARFSAYNHQPSSFLLLSSFSFDSSIVGIFWTLAAGGRLVLPRPGEELDVQILSGLIEDQAVSHTLALPSLYRLLLDFADATALVSLKTVVVAGEACTADLVDVHVATLPETELHNEYGPTEASVWCTVYHCTGDHNGSVPLGRPIPGATVSVVDQHGRPSGFGVPGEIVIAGPGLATGYLNRPELTAERFVEVDGRRWFRTRDRGVVRPDGLIEFGGRVDDQVKIRGHRVELGEVEAVVIAHPEVNLAVVVAHTDGERTGTSLMAFVEPVVDAAGGRASGATDSELSASVQAAVADRLPDPFVPSRVLIVDRLPRLPNGKVDRSRLPAITPDTNRHRHRPPGTETERIIADIWQDLLPDQSFGVDDDFFDVGGHSLLAVALVERIRRATGNELPLAALLDTPTVSGLASAVSGDGPAPEWQCLVPLRETGSRVPLYMIPPAAGTALSFREFVANADPDQPLYCFEPLGTDGVLEPHDTVEAMADLYIAELKAAQPDGRYRIGGSCLGAIVAWEMACKLAAAGTPVELLVFLDPGPPHSGPTWSYSLPLRRSPLEFVRSAVDIVTSGELLSAVQAVWRRNRFERIGRIHYRAQLSYVADRLDDVSIIWLESQELATDQPGFLAKWRVLAGDELTPIIVPSTTHDGLMTGQPDEVARMTELFNQAMSVFEQSDR